MESFVIFYANYKKDHHHIPYDSTPTMAYEKLCDLKG